MTIAHRNWVPTPCETHIQSLAEQAAKQSSIQLISHIEQLSEKNKQIHEKECFNLNPATNVMNPRAEALLASGIGSRPSLGYPGDKYEMGLEAIEEIEVIAAQLSAEIFEADYAEIRVPSGAIANLYGFMTTCKPGDTIIVPPASIGGHVTHHLAGCAGLYGLKILEAPILADGYSIDSNALRDLAKRENPKLITIGGSLNLFEHPVRDIRKIADEIGAKVMFDAAHQCGIIAGKAWRNPLHDGAHFMTMSTYKSLGGPANGLIVSNDPEIAQKLDSIAFPGMTANFDAAKSAALAITMLDWRDFGQAYASSMIEMSQTLANELDKLGFAVFSGSQGFTNSHQFALDAVSLGGGQTASKKLRKAGFLACGIGLPTSEISGDLNGLRIGTPELVRWGMTKEHAPELARLIAKALKSNDPTCLSQEVSTWRQSFDQLHFMH